MNDSSNSRWTPYSESLKLHIAASMRGLRSLVYYAILRSLRSFFEAEQHEGGRKAYARIPFNLYASICPVYLY